MTGKKIRFVSGLLILFLFITFLSCNINKTDGNRYRFVFMTDIHIQPELGGAEGFKTAIKYINSLQPNPDFVITGGDLIMDALRQDFGRADSLYELYIETCKLFDMPVYNTIGNHELFGLYPKSNVDPSHPEYGKKMFMNRLGEGKTYRSFDYKNWHFILLDGIGTTPERKYIGEVDSVQLEWMKQDLRKVGTERPIVIVTHIPFFTIAAQYKDGPTKPNSQGFVIINAHEISKMCEDYNLKLVLQGHLHIVEDLSFRGVHYITAGAVSGSWWKGPRYGFPEGFAVVDLSENDFKWSYETFGWDATQYNNN